MSDRMDRLWAGWRSAYVAGAEADVRVPDGDGTVFERILQSDWPDEETYVLWRGVHCAALLNVYPYGTGHLMVMPTTAVPTLTALEPEAFVELWEGVRSAVVAIEAAYRPDGVNVGTNIGRAGGASIPDHLHVHCLPRWTGDTTFLTSIAQTRMLPEPLDLTWRRLRDCWPEASAG